MPDAGLKSPFVPCWGSGDLYGGFGFHSGDTQHDRVETNFAAMDRQTDAQSGDKTEPAELRALQKLNGPKMSPLSNTFCKSKTTSRENEN